MEQILDTGIKINLFFQGLGGWLRTPMELLSFLGTELFYLLVIPAIYWCWNAALGIRIGLLLMISSSLNSVIKLFLHQPRPYWYDPSVKALAEETSFGIPSGHAQNAVVVWGGIAAWINRAWAWIIAILLMLLIGLSRIYLGVHFPTDVLVGWFIGAIILAVYLVLEKPVKKWVLNQSPLIQILTAFLGSALLILLIYVARTSLGDFSVPKLWLENARLAFPESEPINPISMTGVYSNAGAIFGLSLGLILLQRKGGFDPAGVWWKRILRFVVGVIGLLILYFGLKLFFPDGNDFLANSLRYVRYAIIGIWISWLAPVIFITLKLAKPARS